MCTSTLYLGFKLLVLAHVRLKPMQSPLVQGHRKLDSDELIQDLEYQLGDTTTEYLNIQVSFRHSGFPEVDRQLCIAGVTRTQTKIETYAVAVIKRHNSSSPWSPPPAPQTNPLSAIIASNWGADAANDVMHRILGSRSAPRKAANASPGRLECRFVSNASSNTGSTASGLGGIAPLVPKRQASLQRWPRVLGYGKGPSRADAASSDADDERDSDPARRIWAEMRRLSTGGKSSCRERHRDVLPHPSVFPSTTGVVSQRTPDKNASPASTSCARETIMQREGVREQTPGSGKSIRLVGGTLQGRVQGMMASDVGGGPGDGYSGVKVAALGSSLRSRMNYGSVRGKKEKDTGRWGWGGWWQ